MPETSQLRAFTAPLAALTPHGGRSLSGSTVRSGGFLQSGPPTQTVGPLPRLKHWHLVQRVAEGNLAEVFRARPADAAPDLPAGYAIKVLRPQWEQDARAVQLMRQEALVARAVQHPHVVTVLGAALGQPPYFLVMPWLCGATLRERLRPGRPLEPHRALWIARQAAAALEVLDRGGWMHGDVKPSNLFLSPEGHLTLLDLGFARPTVAPETLGQRCVMGTCSYLAPELVSNWVRPGIHSDIYSLGVVLFEMLAGRLPFPRRDSAVAAAAHKHETPPPLVHVAPHVSGDVSRLVQRMLAKDPLRRPESPGELLAELVRLEVRATAQWAELLA